MAACEMGEEESTYMYVRNISHHFETVRKM